MATALKYLQANFSAGETVEFIALGNVYVFQDNGAAVDGRAGLLTLILRVWWLAGFGWRKSDVDMGRCKTEILQRPST